VEPTRITDFQSVILALTYGLGSPWYIAINSLYDSIFNPLHMIVKDPFFR